MALKNSKTGSLPVSEIYNFMTEHFPYFKVSPKSTPPHHPQLLVKPDLSGPEESIGRQEMSLNEGRKRPCPPPMLPFVSTSEGPVCVGNRELKPFTQGHTAGLSQISCWEKVGMAIPLGFQEHSSTPNGERELGKK